MARQGSVSEQKEFTGSAFGLDPVELAEDFRGCDRSVRTHAFAGPRSPAYLRILLGTYHHCSMPVTPVRRIAPLEEAPLELLTAVCKSTR